MNLSFFKIYRSPLKAPKLQCYFGEIKHGVPYFLPRKLKGTQFKPVKYFWVQFNSLEWKTKWSDDDFRFEWSPMISIVILGKQLCFWLVSPIDNDYVYWETWLTYEYTTSKKESKLNRFYQLIKNYSNLYTTYTKEGKYSTDYYLLLLKKKYKKLYENRIL